MTEKTQAPKTVRKLVSRRRGSLMTGLNPYTFGKAAEAAGIEIVGFPGLPPKYWADQVEKMLADARNQGVGA